MNISTLYARVLNKIFAPVFNARLTELEESFEGKIQNVLQVGLDASAKMIELANRPGPAHYWEGVDEHGKRITSTLVDEFLRIHPVIINSKENAQLITKVTNKMFGDDHTTSDIETTAQALLWARALDTTTEERANARLAELEDMLGKIQKLAEDSDAKIAYIMSDEYDEYLDSIDEKACGRERA